MAGITRVFLERNLAIHVRWDEWGFGSWCFIMAVRTVVHKVFYMAFRAGFWMTDTTQVFFDVDLSIDMLFHRLDLAISVYCLIVTCMADLGLHALVNGVTCRTRTFWFGVGDFPFLRYLAVAFFVLACAGRLIKARKYYIDMFVIIRVEKGNLTFRYRRMTHLAGDLLCNSLVKKMDPMRSDLFLFPIHFKGAGIVSDARSAVGRMAVSAQFSVICGGFTALQTIDKADHVI